MNIIVTDFDDILLGAEDPYSVNKLYQVYIA